MKDDLIAIALGAGVALLVGLALWKLVEVAFGTLTATLSG